MTRIKEGRVLLPTAFTVLVIPGWVRGKKSCLEGLRRKAQENKKP
jgi:hypothetical protein